MALRKRTCATLLYDLLALIAYALRWLRLLLRVGHTPVQQHFKLQRSIRGCIVCARLFLPNEHFFTCGVCGDKHDLCSRCHGKHGYRAGTPRSRRSPLRTHVIDAEEGTYSQDGSKLAIRPAPAANRPRGTPTKARLTLLSWNLGSEQRFRSFQRDVLAVAATVNAAWARAKARGAGLVVAFQEFDLGPRGCGVLVSSAPPSTHFSRTTQARRGGLEDAPAAEPEAGRRARVGRPRLARRDEEGAVRGAARVARRRRGRRRGPRRDQRRPASVRGRAEPGTGAQDQGLPSSRRHGRRAGP